MPCRNKRNKSEDTAPKIPYIYGVKGVSVLNNTTLSLTPLRLYSFPRLI